MALHRAISSVTAAALQSGYQLAGTISAGTVLTSYAGGTVPSWARYVQFAVVEDVAFKISVGQVIAGTIGVPYVGAGERLVPISASGGTLYAMGITGTLAVYYGFLADLGGG